MKILVVGSGGREHALVITLQKNPKNEIMCAPGNAGIQAAGARCFDVKATDPEGICDLVRRIGIGFVIVAPDDPLAMGMVDELNRLGIPTFGPNQAAARIESSKVFSKDLMRKYNIPTADYQVFSDPVRAAEYTKAAGKYPAVIKADGLALGKGVVIAQNQAEAENAINSIMKDKVFGDSGNEIVIEEFLTGPEVSVLAFCDGDTIHPMVSSMDHKRALDGNQGLNTGGMGAIAPNPHYTPEIAERCMREIFLPTMSAMGQEDSPFSGCLYFGLMLTGQGPKVIEYNCRFGDPEAQVVLSLLETDLFEIMEAIYEKRLKDMEIKWKKGASACVILASGGYPGRYETGIPIQGLLPNGQVSGGAQIYHAGTCMGNKEFLTAGGRVMGVAATGDNVSGALRRAYNTVKKVSFEGMHYRKDIGTY